MLLGLVKCSRAMTEQDVVLTLPLTEVFQGQSAQSQGTASTRKRAGSESNDAAMKRQRKEQTSARDVSSCGWSVHRRRQKLKPSLPTFPGGMMQGSYLESPGIETHVGEAAMGERPNESKNEQQRMTSMCEHQREKSTCKECKRSITCEHQRRRSRCKE